MHLSKILLEKKKVLVVDDPKTGFSSALVFFKNFKKERLAYITTVRKIPNVRSLFKSKRIPLKKVLIASTATWKELSGPKQDRYGYYLNSRTPEKLITYIEKFVRHDFDAIVFDSLSDMLEHEKMEKTVRFVSDAISRINEGKTPAVFYTENDPDLVSKISKYFDEVIYLDK